MSDLHPILQRVVDFYGPMRRPLLYPGLRGSPTATDLGTWLAEQVTASGIELHSAAEAARALRGTSGPGAMTAVLLYTELLRAGRILMTSGYSYPYLRAEWEALTKDLINHIQGMSTPGMGINELYDAAYTACGDTRLATRVSTELGRVGPWGQLSATRGYGRAPSTRNVPGVILPCTVPVYHFLVHYGHNVRFQRPWVLITDTNITLDQIADLLGSAAQRGIPLMVFSRTPEPLLSRVILANVCDKRLDCMLFAIPLQDSERRDWQEDMRRLTGARVFTPQSVPAQFTAEDVGELAALEVRGGVVIAEPQELLSDTDEYVVKLRKQLAGESEDFHRERLQRRLSMLAGRGCDFYSGGETPQESDLNYRVLADTVHSTRSVQRGGRVPGAGHVFRVFSRDSHPSTPAARAFTYATSAPYRVLAGSRHGELLHDFVWDARKNRPVAARVSHIVDSTTALVTAVKTASASALTVLSTY